MPSDDPRSLCAQHGRRGSAGRAHCRARRRIRVTSWAEVIAAQPGSLLSLLVPIERGFGADGVLAIAAPDLLGSRAERADAFVGPSDHGMFAFGEIRVGDDKIADLLESPEQCQKVDRLADPDPRRRRIECRGQWIEPTERLTGRDQRDPRAIAFAESEPHLAQRRDALPDVGGRRRRIFSRQRVAAGAEQVGGLRRGYRQREDHGARLWLVRRREYDVAARERGRELHRDIADTERSRGIPRCCCHVLSPDQSIISGAFPHPTRRV